MAARAGGRWTPACATCPRWGASEHDEAMGAAALVRYRLRRASAYADSPTARELIEALMIDARRLNGG